MKAGFKKITLAAACVAALGGFSLPVYAVNWLGLQGTEPADSSGRAKVWGFIQAQYQKDTSNANKAGEFIPPELVGPNLNSQSTFNINRARIGVRGTGFPLDSSVNYFLLVEYGNNALTSPRGGSTLVSDASITVSRIPDAHVRVGLFKYPGADEGFQGIATFAYINFTEVTNQLLLERFPNRSWTPDRSQYKVPNSQALFNRFNRPVGAFRDTGIEVFNTFKYHGWQNNYAVMIGNGNGMNFTDNNSNKDTYFYLSSEKVYGGKGPFQQGLKFFIWHQQGKRVLYNPDGTNNTDGGAIPVNDTASHKGRTEYDRMREGLGMTYRRGQFRATAEYMKGKGMIFLGPDNPSFTILKPVYNSSGTLIKTLMLADGRNGKAHGWYVEGGWFIPRSNWELDARYGEYKRLTDAKKLFAGAPCAFEFDFKTTTLGAQYHFNKLTRLTIDAASRNFDAVDCKAGVGPNANLTNVGNRYSIQLTHIF